MVCCSTTLSFFFATGLMLFNRKPVDDEICLAIITLASKWKETPCQWPGRSMYKEHKIWLKIKFWAIPYKRQWPDMVVKRNKESSLWPVRCRPYKRYTRYPHPVSCAAGCCDQSCQRLHWGPGVWALRTWVICSHQNGQRIGDFYQATYCSDTFQTQFETFQKCCYFPGQK